MFFFFFSSSADTRNIYFFEIYVARSGRTCLVVVHIRFQFFFLFFYISSCVSLFVLAVKYCDNKNLKKKKRRRKRTNNKI